MHAWVRIRHADRVATLTPGDLIGRTWSAALRIDDPRVSEAHAMVSLRGDRLVLLPLRRRLYLDHRPVDSVALERGQRVHLASHLELAVEDLAVPSHVLGLEGDGLPAQVLSGTSSLVLLPTPSLEPGMLDRASALFWPNDDRWRMRLRGEEDTDFIEGTTFSVGSRRFRGVLMALSAAGQTPTRVDGYGPVRIVAQYDTVHIHRGHGPPLVLSGQMARIVSELVAASNPLPWEQLAAPLWPQLDERHELRKRWDVLLVRLRDRLQGGGVRSDLVQSTRVGLVELVRQEGDSVEDRG